MWIGTETHSTGIWLNTWENKLWPWFNMKMSLYQHRKSHCRDKTILLPPYLHNGASYTVKIYLYIEWKPWSALYEHQFTSLRLSDAHMCQQTRPSLVQIMACRLFGAKPLSEPIYSELNAKEHISVKYYLKSKSFHSRKCIWRNRLWNSRPFCLGLNVLMCFRVSLYRTKSSRFYHTCRAIVVI